MIRKERENMVRFLSRVKEMPAEKLVVLTDDDLEHLYSRSYNDHEIYQQEL